MFRHFQLDRICNWKQESLYFLTPSVCVSLGITLRNSALDTKCFDVINIIITINADYFPKHYLQIGFIMEKDCSLLGRNWYVV